MVNSIVYSKLVTKYSLMWDGLWSPIKPVVIAIANFIFSIRVLSHILAYFTSLVQRLFANWDILLAFGFVILGLIYFYRPSVEQFRPRVMQLKKREKV